MRQPAKVKGCALSFFKRFLLERGPFEIDFRSLALACLYLAAKVEECYLSAESLSNASSSFSGHHLEASHGIPLAEKQLLASELPLLRGLRFELVAYSPYRSAAAITADGCISGRCGDGSSSCGSAGLGP